MNGKRMLYISQYGMRYYASTVKDLAEQLGRARGTAKRMYLDTKEGTRHTGYVIGKLWLTAYQPYEGKP